MSKKNDPVSVIRSLQERKKKAGRRMVGPHALELTRLLTMLIDAGSDADKVFNILVVHRRTIEDHLDDLVILMDDAKEVLDLTDCGDLSPQLEALRGILGTFRDNADELKAAHRRRMLDFTGSC